MTAAFYDIHHTLFLSGHQRRLLALGITKLHNTAFVVPPHAVQVKFTYSTLEDYYVGGKLSRACNHIFAYIHRIDGGFVEYHIENSGYLNGQDDVARRLVDGIKFLWESYICNGIPRNITEVRLHAVMVIPGAIGGAWNKSIWSKDELESGSNSYLTTDVNTPGFCCCTFKITNSSTKSTSNYSLDTWDTRNSVNRAKNIHNEGEVETDSEKIPTTRCRLNRKAKFHRL